jgi:hypothetical protein
MKRIIAGTLTFVLLVGSLCGCAGFQRSMKTIGSDITGGLDRTVTVYSYDGEKLGEWSGKFDVSSSEQETFFDINGKRVILQGGIIINEEH